VVFIAISIASSPQMLRRWRARNVPIPAAEARPFPRRCGAAAGANGTRDMQQGGCICLAAALRKGDQEVA
jgi:hypothetical protein